MQAEKPKIASKPSLKKPEAEDVLPVPQSKPIPKPRPSTKPSNLSSQPQAPHPTTDIQTNTNAQPTSKPEVNRPERSTVPEKKKEEDPEVRELSVKITNKLKINASDLAKLRSRNWNEASEAKANMEIYDVREDEEQIRKMEEISELLIVAGYFRARIKGLHNFDKIIGGMCWAIQMCNIDLDIDIFYQDSLSIGQKIALTEKIVHVLERMKCPHKLEPHQIQGMDCIHIFPVIQWLIKRSLETRQANADTIRAHASWQFTRSFPTSQPINSNSILFHDDHIANKSVNPLKSELERRFVHPSRDSIQDQELRSKTTILEYGILGLGQGQRLLTGGDAKAVASESEKRSKNLELPEGQQKPRSESDSAGVENLLSVMSEADLRVDAGLIGNILSEQSPEVRRLAAEYENTSVQELSLEQQFNKREAKYRNAIANKKSQLRKMKEKDDVEKKLEVMKEKIEMVNEKMLEMDKLDETTIQERLLSTEVLAGLRKQKIDFKQHCREEQKKLEDEIEALKKARHSDKSPAKSKSLESELEKLEARHEMLKKELAETNKQHVSLTRKFAEIPTRTELAQYQKRFIELYNQLSTKHNETKKFYTMYNVLADQRMYLEKEFTLINSVLENFNTAQNSSTSVKDEFLVKFEQIVDSIVQSRMKLEQQLMAERTKRDQLNTQHIDLLEQQRKYYMAVNHFKEECARNESLIAALES